MHGTFPFHERYNIVEKGFLDYIKKILSPHAIKKKTFETLV